MKTWHWFALGWFAIDAVLAVALWFAFRRTPAGKVTPN